MKIRKRIFFRHAPWKLHLDNYFGRSKKLVKFKKELFFDLAVSYLAISLNFSTDDQYKQ